MKIIVAKTIKCVLTILTFKLLPIFMQNQEHSKKSMHVSNFSFSELIVVDHFTGFGCLNLGVKLKVHTHYNW